MISLRWPIILPGVGLLVLITAALWLSTSYHDSPKLAQYVSQATEVVHEASDAFAGDLLEQIYNSTLGFQKIFVLNLPARTDNKDTVTLAASLTGLDIEFIDGVTNVSSKALPPGDPEKDPLRPAELGNWRAHMNAIQYIVQHNIQSALILEDDADWDIRIKSQMQKFAQATRLLMQPIPGHDNEYLDPTYPRPKNVDQKPQNIFINNQTASKPTTSPYGDLKRWDMFWIGHCGTHFPEAKKGTTTVPLGRAVILDDITVPQRQHVKMQFGDDVLITEYPDHTRVVTRANQNLCSLGYAVSLPGARRLLYELGVHKLSEGTDVSFQRFCDGSEDRPTRKCFTVQPQLFQHHRPRGSKNKFSDISGHGDEFNEQAFTRNVRWSTRLNFKQLVDDETEYLDLWQDNKPFVDYGWG